MRIGLPIVFIIVIFALIQIDKLFDTTKIRGNVGESIVASILSKLGDEYIVDNDVPVGKAQIDHLVIFGKVMFVIETKNWRGKIVGIVGDEKWKQINHGECKWYKNPVKQNEFHIDELRKVYDGYQMVSIVVFIGNRNFPKLKNVISEYELYHFIADYPNV